MKKKTDPTFTTENKPILMTRPKTKWKQSVYTDLAAVPTSAKRTQEYRYFYPESQ